MSSTVWEKQAQALKAAGAADRKPAFSLPSKDIKKQSMFSGCLQNFVRPVSLGDGLLSITGSEPQQKNENCVSYRRNMWCMCIIFCSVFSLWGSCISP